MGNPIIRTPHIDQLSRCGVTFNNAFVTTAICMTSRASILLGQYAARHGDWKFEKPFTPEQLAATYPALLKQAGYTIGFIGKWGVGDSARRTVRLRSHVPRPRQLLRPARRQAGAPHQPDGRSGARVPRRVPADRPFCLSISFKAPHEQDSESVIQQPFLFDPAHASWYADVNIPPPKLAANEYYDACPNS